MVLPSATHSPDLTAWAWPRRPSQQVHGGIPHSTPLSTSAPWPRWGGGVPSTRVGLAGCLKVVLVYLTGLEGGALEQRSWLRMEHVGGQEQGSKALADGIHLSRLLMRPCTSSGRTTRCSPMSR